MLLVLQPRAPRGTAHSRLLWLPRRAADVRLGCSGEAARGESNGCGAERGAGRGREARLYAEPPPNPSGPAAPCAKGRCPPRDRRACAPPTAACRGRPVLAPGGTAACWLGVCVKRGLNPSGPCQFSGSTENRRGVLSLGNSPASILTYIRDLSLCILYMSYAAVNAMRY